LLSKAFLFLTLLGTNSDTLRIYINAYGTRRDRTTAKKANQGAIALLLNLSLNRETSLSIKIRTDTGKGDFP
jgi:hypothetical protein